MNDDMKKNQIMAIALSLAVLLGWQFLFVQPREQERARQAQMQKSAVPGAQGTTAPGAAAPIPVAADGTLPSSAGAAAGAPTGLPRVAALALSPRIAIATPDLSGSIALKGGRIDDLVLTRYNDTPKPDSPKVVLLEPAGSKASYFAEFGWVPAANGDPATLVRAPVAPTVKAETLPAP